MRENTSSTLLTLSAAAIALLISSPMLFFNVLLQPVQATQLPTIAFKTPKPAISFNGSLALTFEAEGTACYSSCDNGGITSGTFVLNHTDGSGQVDSGTIQVGSSSSFENGSSGVTIALTYLGKSGSYVIFSSCSTSDTNVISVLEPTDSSEHFKGVVECPVGVGEGEAHSAQPTSSTPMTATTTRESNRDSRDGDGDSDGDGIPDSSDRCTHNSNPRCFKEGEASTTTSTTTTQQLSSSSIAGN